MGRDGSAGQEKRDGLGGLSGFGELGMSPTILLRDFFTLVVG
jgi:hypothetical protein